MSPRQHVWLGPHATAWEADCEACLHAHESVAAHLIHLEGTLPARADVGFTSCRRGHRIVLRRIGRPLAHAV